MSPIDLAIVRVDAAAAQQILAQQWPTRDAIAFVHHVARRLDELRRASDVAGLLELADRIARGEVTPPPPIPPGP